MKRRKNNNDPAPQTEGGRAKRAAAGAMMFLRKNVYVILMIVCVLAIAAMIIVAAVYNANKDEGGDVPGINVPDDGDTITPENPDDKPGGTEEPEKPQWTFAPEMPVQGEITLGHSVDELVFSATDGKWLAHIGTDIACSAGSEVKAMFEGKVSAVESDSYYGTVIEITHENGYVTTYKLLDSPAVKVGDSVSTGDVIGVVGKDFYYECADGEHIHVELTVNGESKDITTYLKEGDK